MCIITSVNVKVGPNYLRQNCITNYKIKLYCWNWSSHICHQEEDYLLRRDTVQYARNSPLLSSGWLLAWLIQPRRFRQYILQNRWTTTGLHGVKSSGMQCYNILNNLYCFWKMKKQQIFREFDKKTLCTVSL